MYLMEINKKSKIGVLCGGISSEREISLRSGTNCTNALLKSGYINTVQIDVKSTKDLISLKDKIEVAFLVTHGRFGEDGSIQGILDWLRIPYTGSSVLASAISMDKWLTKKIADHSNSKTPKGILCTKKTTTANLKNAWESLAENGAVFLKPRDDGSSVNTFKIKSFKELKDSIKRIDLNTSDYLIEEFIPGRELTASIIETDNELRFLPILELKPKNEFYDYEAKYKKGMTEFILPARIDKKIHDLIKANSIKLFTDIGCSSFGRVDYILDKDNNPYLLEVNSLPGMTDTSDLPAQAKEAGISYEELVETVLKSAKLHK